MGNSRFFRRPRIGDAKVALGAAVKSDQLGTILLLAFRPALITVGLIAAVTLVVLLLASSPLGGLASAISLGWLALHGISINIGGADLGFLPIAGSAALLYGSYRNCRAAITPEYDGREVASLIGATVAGPLLVSAIAVAVVDDASMTTAVGHADTFIAAGLTVSLHLAAGLAAIIATRRDIVRALVPVPHWLVVGVVAGRQALVDLAVVAVIVTVAVAAWNWPSEEAISAPHGALADWALGGFTVLYLPNLLSLTMSVLVGGSVTIGGDSLSLAAVSIVDQKTPPVLAAIPQGPAQLWWLVGLAAPIGVGIKLALLCRRELDDKWIAARAALIASVVAGFGAAAVIALASGTLGYIGWVGATGTTSGLMLTGWLALVGGGLTLAYRARPASRTAAPGAGLVVEPQVLELEVVEAEVLDVEVEQPAVEGGEDPLPADVIDAEVEQLPDQQDQAVAGGSAVTD